MTLYNSANIVSVVIHDLLPPLSVLERVLLKLPLDGSLAF